MRNAKTMMILASFFMVLTVACGQKKSDGSSSVRGGTNSVGTDGTSINVTAGPSGMPEVEYIEQDAAITGSTLAAGAKAFLLGDDSQTPQDIGTIIGVSIMGDVMIDHQTGAVLPQDEFGNESFVSLIVNESLQGEREISLAASSGRASNGKAKVIFEDEFGTVTVEGTYNTVSGTTGTSIFKGRVSFVNANGTSGTLGNFSVATCSFFRCL